MSRKTGGQVEGRDETGHVLIGGARWHWPAPGQPEACGVPGCDRVLGLMPAEDISDEEETDDLGEPEMEAA